MAETPISLKEKKEISQVITDLIMEVLWHPRIPEATGDTGQHHVRVWKENGCVHAEVRRVR